MNLIERAASFAERAHRNRVNEDGSIGHKRKYTGECYTVHTKAVATMLAVHGMSPEIVAAAHLHDTVEDCGVTLDEIEATFGRVVRQYVDDVTDVSKPSDGIRPVRKALDREHIANASAGGQTIKCADLIDNTKSIVPHDPDFARVYLSEKEAILSVITRADPTLLALAWETLREGQRMLVQHSLSKLHPAGG